MKAKSYKRQELLNLSERDWDKVSRYKQLLIVPSYEIARSGYRVMAIIGCEDGEPKEIVGYCEDIFYVFKKSSNAVHTDMFPNNILRFYTTKGNFVIKESLSETEIEYEHPS